MAQRVQLEEVRKILVGMEDTIVIALAFRGQLPLNAGAYGEGGGIVVPGREGRLTLNDYLMDRETLDATWGRYGDRREHSFFFQGSVPAMLRGYPQPLEASKVNRNQEIYDIYLASALRMICRDQRDLPTEYCSGFEADVTALHEISRRVHLGEFVAESKWQDEEDAIRRLVETRDIPALTEALRNRTVERAVTERVGDKAERHQIDAVGAMDFYVHYVMPLTIDVEVDYLLATKGGRSMTDEERTQYREMVEREYAQLRSALHLDRIKSSVTDRGSTYSSKPVGFGTF
jgi:chorismate mutase